MQVVPAATQLVINNVLSQRTVYKTSFQLRWLRVATDTCKITMYWAVYSIYTFSTENEHIYTYMHTYIHTSIYNAILSNKMQYFTDPCFFLFFTCNVTTASWRIYDSVKNAQPVDLALHLTTHFLSTSKVKTVRPDRCWPLSDICQVSCQGRTVSLTMFGANAPAGRHRCILIKVKSCRAWTDGWLLSNFWNSSTPSFTPHHTRKLIKWASMFKTSSSNF